MKAILGVAAAATRLDRAASALDVGCDAAPPSRRMRMTAPTKNERRERPVSAMATALLSPRLLDQRLDEGLDLLTLERPAVRNLGRLRGRARRGGNGHACLHSNIELVLLVH